MTTARLVAEALAYCDDGRLANGINNVAMLVGQLADALTQSTAALAASEAGAAALRLVIEDELAHVRRSDLLNKYFRIEQERRLAAALAATIAGQASRVILLGLGRRGADETDFQSHVQEGARIIVRELAASPELREVAEALEALLAAVKLEPGMNHRRYDALGVRVNKALATLRAILAGRADKRRT